MQFKFIMHLHVCTKHWTIFITCAYNIQRLFSTRNEIFVINTLQAFYKKNAFNEKKSNNKRIHHMPSMLSCTRVLSVNSAVEKIWTNGEKVLRILIFLFIDVSNLFFLI
jgi:hypothetical protein